MEQRTTHPRRRRSAAANWRRSLWIMFGVAGAVGVGTPIAYAASTTREVAQRRGPDATLLFFGCTGLAILILAILIRLFHQRFAPRYNRQLVSTRSIDEVLALIGELFPARDVVGRPWVWKRSPSDPQVLELSAYPLPYWAGCLIMLVTGIIWGSSPGSSWAVGSASPFAWRRQARASASRYTRWATRRRRKRKY